MRDNSFRPDSKGDRHASKQEDDCCFGARKKMQMTLNVNLMEKTKSGKDSQVCFPLTLYIFQVSVTF